MHIDEAPMDTLLVATVKGDERFLLRTRSRTTDTPGTFALYTEPESGWSIDRNVPIYPGLKVALDLGFTHAWSINALDAQNVRLWSDLISKPTVEVRFGVMSVIYPLGLRPAETRTESFWSGTEDERTFAYVVLDNGTETLVVPESDPRSRGMRIAREGGPEDRCLREAGFDRETTYVWSLPSGVITPIEDSIKGSTTLIEATNPGDWFTWGARLQWFRCERVEDSRIYYDQSVTVDLDEPCIEDHRGSYFARDLVHDGNYEAFSPTAEGLHPVIKTLQEEAKKRLAEGLDIRAVILNGDRPATQEDFDGLRRERDLLSERVAELARERDTARSHHSADISKIGERLIEEAESRSWCGEYDEIVNDLNTELNIELPLRRRSYIVTMDVTVRVYKTVEAVDEDEAYEIASEEIRSEDLDMDNHRNTDHVVTTRD